MPQSQEIAAGTENDICNLAHTNSIVVIKMVRSHGSSNPIFKLSLVSAGILISFACIASPAIILEAFAQAATSPPVTVETDNGSVKLIVSWTPNEIQAGKNVDLSLEFQDPTSGQDLSHVNYDFKVLDSNGTAVTSADNVHTHSGQDIQTVMFNKVGDFNVQVKVIGLGLTEPFDTSKSGTAQTSIMVVPEFPLPLAVLAAGGVITFLVSRYSNLFGLA